MKRVLSLAAALPAALVAPTLVSASAPTVPSAGSVFAAKLDQLPASFLANDSVMLTYVDMSLAWERLGVGTDPAERLDALGRTGDIETFTQPGEMFGPWAAQVDDARAEVGFSMFEIDREAALVAPPYRVIVADTTVPATAIADAVTTDPLWSADLNAVESETGPYWTWGDDPMAQDISRRSPMRQLGQGGALAVVGDAPATAVRTLTAEDAEATIRAIGGTDPSVADEGPFAPVVEVVGDADVVQALGSTAMATYMPPLSGDADDVAEAVESATRFLPYASSTVVETLVDGEYHTSIVVVHFDAASATANADIAATWLAEGTDAMTQRPISDVFPDATITTDGTVLVVELGSATPYAHAVRMLTAGALFPV